MIKIPTYKDSCDIVNDSGGFVFYETKHIIDGYNISLFDYRLASYSDFMNPIKEKNINSKELRGLCFVFNSDGTLYKRFIMLHKFWNLNQVPSTQYEVIKNKPINSIYNKEDGSLISFIELPNGRIIPKTKMGFSNDQTEGAKKIYVKNKNINNFVNWCLKNNLSAMWEFVSFENKIVLNYNEPNLILLRVRNNETGEYLNIEQFRNKGFDVVKSENFNSLDDMISLSETLENKEGWVIQCGDDFIKLKTKWYFIHHALFDEMYRENLLIEIILNDKLDDVLCQLNNVIDSNKIEFINNVDRVVKKELSNRITDIEKLVSKFNGDIKDFAIRYKKEENFSIAINHIRSNKNIYELTKDWLRKKTKFLMFARLFIKNEGFKN